MVNNNITSMTTPCLLVFCSCSIHNVNVLKLNSFRLESTCLGDNSQIEIQLIKKYINLQIQCGLLYFDFLLHHIKNNNVWLDWQPAGLLESCFAVLHCSELMFTDPSATKMKQATTKTNVYTKNRVSKPKIYVILNYTPKWGTKWKVFFSWFIYNAQLSALH